MDLILWRHADAEPAHAGLTDLDRRLTEKGEEQARRMATWLRRALPDATRIIVSPALRAQQTAQALALDFEIVPSIAPGVSADQLLRAADWPHAPHAVLVVGHQPTLGKAAARLMAGTALNWSIRKAGVWWLCADREGVCLSAVRSPDDD